MTKAFIKLNKKDKDVTAQERDKLDQMCGIWEGFNNNTIWIEDVDGVAILPRGTKTSNFP